MDLDDPVRVIESSCLTGLDWPQRSGNGARLLAQIHCLTRSRRPAGAVGPPTFRAGAHGALQLVGKTIPSERVDVYPQYQGRIGGDEQIQWLLGRARAQPTFASGLDEHAMLTFQEREIRMLQDGTLARAQQAAVRRQCERIRGASRGAWERWRQLEPSAAEAILPSVWAGWLTWPFDVAEQAWFAPDWNRRDFGVVAASDFFDRCPPWFLGYLQVGRGVLQSQGVQCSCAVLEVDATEANRRLAALDLALKFEMTTAAAALWTQRKELRKSKAQASGKSAGH